MGFGNGPYPPSSASEGGSYPPPFAGMQPVPVAVRWKASVGPRPCPEVLRENGLRMAGNRRLGKDTGSEEVLQSCRPPLTRCVCAGDDTFGFHFALSVLPKRRLPATERLFFDKTLLAFGLASLACAASCLSRLHAERRRHLFLYNVCSCTITQERTYV